MKRLLAVLAALLLCLASPAVAAAQLGPQNVPGPLTQDSEEPDTVNLDEDTGFSTTQLVLTFGGAIAVIALIAWVIMRDARRKAPAAGRTSAAGGGGTPGAVAGPKKSAREREREHARKRAKAKAVRDQRKRNRPR